MSVWVVRGEVPQAKHSFAHGDEVEDRTRREGPQALKTRSLCVLSDASMLPAWLCAVGARQTEGTRDRGCAVWEATDPACRSVATIGIAPIPTPQPSTHHPRLTAPESPSYVITHFHHKS